MKNKIGKQVKCFILYLKNSIQVFNNNSDVNNVIARPLIANKIDDLVSHAFIQSRILSSLSIKSSFFLLKHNV